jgi:hypothetical protein
MVIKMQINLRKIVVNSNMYVDNDKINMYVDNDKINKMIVWLGDVKQGVDQLSLAGGL